MSFEKSCGLYYMPSVKFSRSIGQHITAITCFTWAIIKYTEHLTKKHRDNLMLRVIKGTDVRAIKSAAKPGASNHLRSDAQPLARLFDTRQTLQTWSFTWSWTFFIHLISREKKTPNRSLLFNQQINVCTNFYARIHKNAAILKEVVRKLIYLQQELDSLYGSDSCFGDGCGDATSQEILHETNHRVRHGWIGVRVWPLWNPTEVLEEPNAPPKWTRTPPCVLIYGRCLSREFWVMDLYLVEQKTKAE